MSAEQKIVLRLLRGYRDELDAMVGAWIAVGVVDVATAL